VEFTYKLDYYAEAMSLALPSKLLVLCKEEDIDTTYEDLVSVAEWDININI